MLEFIRRKSSNIFVPKATAIKISGRVKGYQTWLNEQGQDSGEIIRDTMFEDHNTINDDLKAHCAYKIVNGAAGAPLLTADLFATENVVTEGTAEHHGIAFADSTGGYDVTWVFITTLNNGGDNTETFVEFYGYHTNSTGVVQAPQGLMLLGSAFDGTNFDVVYAEYSINTSIADGRRYHFYWKISFA